MTTVPTRRELIAWLLATVLALSTVMLFRSDRADAGTPATAGPTTQVVYLATGANFPDALAAAATAALGLGPVLLVQQDAVPEPTGDELGRLQPPRIVIVGGTAVISSGVQAQLEALPWSPQVTRVSGDNRFETAAELSLASFPTSGMYPRVAHAETANHGSGSPTAQDVLSVVIEAPAAGVLFITAGGDYDSAETSTFSCWITLGGAEATGSLRTITLVAGNLDEDCTTEVSIDVGPGSHTVAFRTNADIVATIGQASLSVMWVPFGGTGAIPVP
jgi:hypothetical protein